MQKFNITYPFWQIQMSRGFLIHCYVVGFQDRVGASIFQINNYPSTIHLPSLLPWALEVRSSQQDHSATTYSASSIYQLIG